MKQETDPMGFIPIDRATINIVNDDTFKKPFVFEITDPWYTTSLYNLILVAIPSTSGIRVTLFVQKTKMK